MEQDTGMTTSDRKVLMDIHKAVCGDEFNADKPGLIRTVQFHAVTLFGTDGKNGLNGDNQKYKKLFWVGSGIVIAAQILFAWFIATHTK